VPVVPQSLSCAAATADTGPVIHSYDMDAAFMSFQPHESGIHAVWPGAGRGQRDGSPFPMRTAAGGEARTDQDQLKLTGIVLIRHGSGIHAV
jgi:hypothetical protein